MAIINRERMESLVRKAKALRTDLLLAREEHLTEQLASNVEVRRMSIESEESDSARENPGKLGRLVTADV